MDAIYQNDAKVTKIGANVTTPFTGFERWSMQLLSTKPFDYSIHVETPLVALPSLDASLRAVLETDQRLEVDTILSINQKTIIGGRFELTKNSKTYVTGIELDIPFLESYRLRTFKSRAECQIGGWKNLVISVGEYSARTSILLSRSNVNINAGIKTPSMARSIEMGAGYNANPNLLQGEIFLWGKLNQMIDQFID